MVGRYFWPRLRWKLLLFPLISLILFFINYALAGDSISPAITFVSYLIIFNPIAFASRPDREFTVSLPALTSEKCIFIFLWTLVIMPAVILTPVSIAAHYCYGTTNFTQLISNMTPMLNILSDRSVSFFSMISSLAMTLTCLWAVMWAHGRRDRVLLGIVCPLGFNILEGIAGGIYGFYLGIQILHATGPDTPLTPEDIQTSIGSYLLPFFKWLTPIMIIYTIFAFRKTILAIGRRQL